jgi:hypothetical protein
MTGGSACNPAKLIDESCQLLLVLTEVRVCSHTAALSLSSGTISDVFTLFLLSASPYPVPLLILSALMQDNTWDGVQCFEVVYGD